ncbi:MAG: hypothetical protein ACQCN5_09450 [Candidatus Bathyarchaeia archaeon]|jgi:hypothetical protein
MTSRKGNSNRTIIMVVAVIAVITIALAAGFVSGLFNSSGISESTPTLTPTATPTLTPVASLTPTQTATPTSTPTATPDTSPSPTPQPTLTPLPSPQLSVNVTPSNYNETWAQYTTFVCTVTINNHAYDQLMTKFVNANNITVPYLMNPSNNITGDIAATLPAAFPQLDMNYGLLITSVSDTNNGQFTLTLESYKQTILLGGINVNTLSEALESNLEILIQTQI